MVSQPRQGPIPPGSAHGWVHHVVHSFRWYRITLVSDWGNTASEIHIQCSGVLAASWTCIDANRVHRPTVTSPRHPMTCNQQEHSISNNGIRESVVVSSHGGSGYLLCQFDDLLSPHCRQSQQPVSHTTVQRADNHSTQYLTLLCNVYTTTITSVSETIPKPPLVKA